jgi:hypothetical protein
MRASRELSCVDGACSVVASLLSLPLAASGPAVQLPSLLLCGLPVLCDFHQTMQKLYVRGAGEPNVLMQHNQCQLTDIDALINLCNFDRMRSMNDRASGSFVQKFDAL